MKQPKPMVGQTWEHKDCGVEFILDETTIDNWVQIAYYSIFVPQNDLEWLAVNLDKWYCAADYLRNGSGAPFICNADHPDAISRDQHRNERYRLGLDTKPRYKLINGQWSETK